MSRFSYPENVLVLALTSRVRFLPVCIARYIHSRKSVVLKALCHRREWLGRSLRTSTLGMEKMSLIVWITVNPFFSFEVDVIGCVSS